MLSLTTLVLYRIFSPLAWQRGLRKLGANRVLRVMVTKQLPWNVLLQLSECHKFLIKVVVMLRLAIYIPRAAM